MEEESPMPQFLKRIIPAVGMPMHILNRISMRMLMGMPMGFAFLKHAKHFREKRQEQKL